MSADIAVPQHERVMRFYAQVLCTGEHPLWREDLMNNRGMPVIGLGARTAEHADLPLQWMPHIQVADVARSVERALERGGREILHGRGEDGTSQWAVLLDPNGAAFGVIPVVSQDEVPSGEGAAPRDGAASIGCISWLDLTVANASATRDFYQEVVGWAVLDVEMEDTRGRYADSNMLGDDGKPAAGICHARGVNLGLPPVWILHLPVGDLAESLRRVREGEGKIIKDTTGAGGGHACGIIQDPVGACLALVPG
jgi:predicted enzyme related to lactoylglutathione lyase